MSRRISPFMLRDFVDVAPYSWLAKASEALEAAGLFDDAPDFQSKPGGPDAASKRLVEKMRLSGHEGGVSESLLWDQMMAENAYQVDSADAEFFGVGFAVLNTLDHFKGELKENGGPVFVQLGKIGLEVTLDDVREALIAIWSPEDAARHGQGVSPVDWAESVIECWFSSVPLSEPEGNIPDGLDRACEALLRRHGALKGPCPRCSRSSWLVEPRPAKAPGRPPLIHTYCPTCVVAIQREKNRARTQRHREKQAGPQG
ncbi:hypothetical protein D3C72_809920 [compost metagenome]